jgi:CCR4-NOT transcription complex subunit 1
MLSPEHLERCIEVRNLCLQIHPRLMSLHPNSDVEPGLTVITYSNEIESEVDGIYKQMYDENTTIDEVIAMLQRYKESNNPRDQELFSCMIHFLFDEYKFFQSYYPARELAMTGYLFGSLIRHSLIDHIPLGIAMRYILDALHCHPDTNLFTFGTQALSRFEVRLPDWRPLCEALSGISHLAEARPDLMASIHRALVMPAGPEENSPDPRLMNPNGQYEVVTTFTAIQPDSIAEQLEVPPEELSDKILFIVNNLAPTNLMLKSRRCANNLWISIHDGLRTTWSINESVLNPTTTPSTSASWMRSTDKHCRN